MIESLKDEAAESKTIARVTRGTLEGKLHNKHRNFADQRDLAAFLIALAPDTSLQVVPPGRSSTDLYFSSRPYSNLGRLENAQH
jgi:hypothetical protein